MKSTAIKSFLENTSMYIIQKQDIKKCAKLMASSFTDDPSIRYLLCGEKEGKNDWKYFHTLLKALYGKCVMISTDKDVNDFALLLPPSKKGVSTLPFLFNGGLFLPFFFRMGLYRRSMIYENNCQAIKDKFINKDTWYFMALVVNQNMQGQGRGGKLLRYILENANRMKAPVYLETHKEVNVKIYEGKGFELKDISTIPKTEKKQYAMLWTPKSE